MTSLVILNFHGVGPVPRILNRGERECWLELDFFEAVLELLHNKPNVRLTVDDGNRSDCEVVLPALQRRGLKATFFVCSGRLDQPAFLTRDDVRELQANGMSIGSHGVTHLSWRRLCAARLADELASSRRSLEDVCGLPVDTAACPFGDYDRTVLNALRRAGYRTVYTSDGGTSAANRWLQARTTMRRSMTLGDVQRLVQQGSGAWGQTLIDIRRFFKCLR